MHGPVQTLDHVRDSLSRIVLALRDSDDVTVFCLLCTAAHRELWSLDWKIIFYFLPPFTREISSRFVPLLSLKIVDFLGSFGFYSGKGSSDWERKKRLVWLYTVHVVWVECVCLIFSFINTFRFHVRPQGPPQTIPPSCPGKTMWTTTSSARGPAPGLYWPAMTGPCGPREATSRDGLSRRSSWRSAKASMTPLDSRPMERIWVESGTFSSHPTGRWWDWRRARGEPSWWNASKLWCVCFNVTAYGWLLDWGDCFTCLCFPYLFF